MSRPVLTEFSLDPTFLATKPKGSLATQNEFHVSLLSRRSRQCFCFGTCILNTCAIDPFTVALRDRLNLDASNSYHMST
jgi:hypothetical protein